MNVSIGTNETCSSCAAFVGAIKHRQVLWLEKRCAFDGLCSTNQTVQRFNLFFLQAKFAQAIELWIVLCGRCVNADVFKNLLRHAPSGECETQFKHHWQLIFQRDQVVAGVTLGAEILAQRGCVICNFTIHAWQRGVNAERANDVRHNAVADFIAVTQRFNSGAQTLIGNLEVAAASEFLELGQRKIWFNTSGVAIHEQTNCASWRNDGDLRVAETKFGSEQQCIVPTCQ